MKDENLVIKVTNENTTMYLDRVQVDRIVNEWYLNGMCEDILQTELGVDLEQLTEYSLESDLKIETIIIIKKDET
jgi:hypothetical protein